MTVWAAGGGAWQAAQVEHPQGSQRKHNRAMP